jgi:N-acetylglucosamine kinase-like BadF-type ATPase
VGVAEDGRGPATALCEAVPAHFGVPEVADVAIAIHQGRLTEQDTRGLAPVLLAAAADGDQVARDLVQRQAIHPAPQPIVGKGNFPCLRGWGKLPLPP